MKKKSLFALFLCLIIIFAGCSKINDADRQAKDVPVKTANEIKKDLRNGIGGLSWGDFKITDCEIVDRNTDYDDPSDSVRVLVTSTDEQATVVQGYTIMYLFSDGKWNYNSHEYFNNEKCKITLNKNLLTNNEVYSKVMTIKEFDQIQNGTYFSRFYLEKTKDGELKNLCPTENFKIISHTEDLANLKQNYVVEVTKKTANFEFYEKISLDLIYGSDGLAWGINTATLLESNVKALKAISFTDQFAYNSAPCSIVVTGLNADGTLKGTFEQNGKTVDLSKSDFKDSKICGPYFYMRRSKGQSTYFYINDSLGLEMQETIKE